MSTVASSPLPPAFPPEPIARLTVEQYHGLIAAGLITDEEAVELLEGWLVPKMPKKPIHGSVKELAREALQPYLGSGWFIKSEDPITTTDSEPEPDIAVVRGRIRDYLDRHPEARDLGMVIEVSDTTLARDRGIKKRIFARAGVPVYWIVNLMDRQVEVYTDPTGPGNDPDYRVQQIFKPGDGIAVALDGVDLGRVEVSQVLP